MKTSKLIVDYDYDFEIIGIITSIRGYKLAWLLNKLLKIELSKTDDICLDFLKEGRIQNINYNFQTEYSIFRLIKNKSHEFTNIARPFLLPELKEYDYFIQLNDESGIFDGSDIINKVKTLPGVEFINRIETDSIKSKDNLIF